MDLTQLSFHCCKGICCHENMADEEEQEPNETLENVEFQSERSVRQAKKNARLTQMILKNERNATTRLVCANFIISFCLVLNPITVTMSYVCKVGRVF